nr:hypothetical protein Iba_chr07eCG5960 [Ipomoea batatas]
MLCGHRSLLATEKGAPPEAVPVCHSPAGRNSSFLIADGRRKKPVRCLRRHGQSSPEKQRREKNDLACWDGRSPLASSAAIEDTKRTAAAVGLTQEGDGKSMVGEATATTLRRSLLPSTLHCPTVAVLDLLVAGADFADLKVPTTATNRASSLSHRKPRRLTHAAAATVTLQRRRVLRRGRPLPQSAVELIVPSPTEKEEPVAATRHHELAGKQRREKMTWLVGMGDHHCQAPVPPSPHVAEGGGGCSAGLQTSPSTIAAVAAIEDTKRTAAAVGLTQEGDGSPWSRSYCYPPKVLASVNAHCHRRLDLLVAGASPISPTAATNRASSLSHRKPRSRTHAAAATVTLQRRRVLRRGRPLPQSAVELIVPSPTEKEEPVAATRHHELAGKQRREKMTWLVGMGDHHCQAPVPPSPHVAEEGGGCSAGLQTSPSTIADVAAIEDTKRTAAAVGLTQEGDGSPWSRSYCYPPKVLASVNAHCHRRLDLLVAGASPISPTAATNRASSLSHRKPRSLTHATAATVTLQRRRVLRRGRPLPQSAVELIVPSPTEKEEPVAATRHHELAGKQRREKMTWLVGMGDHHCQAPVPSSPHVAEEGKETVCRRRNRGGCSAGLQTSPSTIAAVAAIEDTKRTAATVGLTQDGRRKSMVAKLLLPAEGPCFRQRSLPPPPGPPRRRCFADL